ncbi:MAG: hypothetical protein VYD54_08020 [Bdellovibrionota bacterium]|nr:hypothetical protein [Bdellovibrionota bacterium]
MKKALFIFLFFSKSIFALTSIEIGTIKGQASFEKKALKEGQKINKKGTVIVGKGSFLGIKISEWNAHLTIAPGTHLVFDFSPQVLKKIFLKKGSLRWTALSNQKNKENKVKTRRGFVFTTQSKVIVRGTDFFLKVGHYFEETEIIVLKGEVVFQSLQDQNDYALLKSPHWSGLGGRFGASIGKPLKLNSQIKNYYELILRFK